MSYFDKQFHDYKKFRQMLDDAGLEFKKDHYSIPPMDKIYYKIPKKNHKSSSST